MGETVHRWQILQTDAGVKLVGDLCMLDATPIWRTLRRLAPLRSPSGAEVDIDLTDANTVDGAIMSLLVELRAAFAARNVRAEIVGASDRVRPIVHLYGGDAPPVDVPLPAAEPRLARLGAFTESHRGAPGDPRSSSANALISEFLGDYVYAAATRTYGAAVWNDSRRGADCPAIDAYRQALQNGQSATAPAVQQVCAANFGNSDIFGGTYPDPTP